MGKQTPKDETPIGSESLCAVNLRGCLKDDELYFVLYYEVSLTIVFDVVHQGQEMPFWSGTNIRRESAERIIESLGFIEIEIEPGGLHRRWEALNILQT